MKDENKAIIEISKAELALDRANEIHEMLDLRDIASAYQVFADAQGFKEAAQKAKIFQLKAERKAGKWLDKNVDHKGGNPKLYQDGTAVPLPDGITRNESSRLQKEASLPEPKFNKWIDENIANGWEISASGLQREAKKHERISSPVSSEKLNHRTIKIIQGGMETEVPKLGKFDLIIADPPYNVTEWEWDKIGSEFLPQTKKWLSICKNALNDKYHLFWFCSPKYSADIEMIFRELSLPIQSRIVWHRRNMSMGSVIKDKFIDSWEMIFHSGNYPLNLPEEWNDKRFDVQTFAVPQTNFGDMKLHPTQKPLELIKLLVEFGSLPNGRVLDPFAGAGTTAAACEGRDYVLIERELEYIKVMEARLSVSH